MAVDSGTWGIEQWSLAIAIAGLAFAFSQPFGFLLQWRQYSEERLKEDPVLRAEWAARLRSGSAGAAYRDALARALAWLDQVFGPPGSIRALGVCFLVAVAYSWVTFFLGWGFFGGSGDIAGLPVVSSTVTQPARGLFATLALGLPFMFIVTRQLSLWSRDGAEWLRERLLQHWPPLLGQRGFRITWWFIQACVVFVGVLAMGALLFFMKGSVLDILGEDPARKMFFVLLFLFLMPSVGVRIGCWVGRYASVRWSSFASNVAVLFFASVGAPLLSIAILFIFFVLVPYAINATGATSTIGSVIGLAVLSVGVVKLGKPSAISYIVALIFCVMATRAILNLAPPSMDAAAYGINAPPTRVFLLTFIFVTTLSGAIGAASALVRRDSRRTLFLGAFGSTFMISPPEWLFSGHLSPYAFHDPLKILFLLFFLILPLVNSLFDWLSWWATRALGRRLLTVLDPASGFWPRLTAILGHGLADLAAAVALLLLMAFALGLGFQVYNDLAIAKGATPPFDLHVMIDAVALHPWTEGFWVTLMLLTTLLPTIGHGVMLLGSPLGLMLIPDRKRLALADDLDGYATAGDRQPSIRRRAARWHVQERTVGWVLGAALLGWLLARIGLLYPLGLAGWVADAAHAGVRAAGYLAGVPPA